MDELRERILRGLRAAFGGKSVGFYEANSFALTIAWRIVNVSYPEASFCEVYEAATQAALVFCFGEGA